MHDIRERENRSNANTMICFEVRATALCPRLHRKGFPPCPHRIFNKGFKTSFGANTCRFKSSHIKIASNTQLESSSMDQVSLEIVIDKKTSVQVYLVYWFRSCVRICAHCLGLWPVDRIVDRFRELALQIQPRSVGRSVDQRVSSLVLASVDRAVDRQAFALGRLTDQSTDNPNNRKYDRWRSTKLSTDRSLLTCSGP